MRTSNLRETPERRRQQEVLDRLLHSGGKRVTAEAAMIVCSCNVIAMASIERAIEELSGGAEPGVVTPGCVYRALGHRPQCGTCLRTVSRLIQGIQQS